MRQSKSRKEITGVMFLALVLLLAAGMMMLTGCGQKDEKEEEGAGKVGFYEEEDEAAREVRAGMEVPEDLEDVNDQISQVSFRMFQQAMRKPAESETSAMISPLSLLTCLSMAQAGAEGNTKTEME